MSVHSSDEVATVSVDPSSVCSDSSLDEESDPEWGGGVTRLPRIKTRFQETLKIRVAGKSELQVFEFFFGESVFQLMKENSEAYASQRGRKFETSTQELRAFVGVTLLTHLIIKSNLEDYWSLNDMLSTPFFPKVFSRNRFAEIQRNLHFSATLPAPDLSDPKRDKLHKVRPLLDLVLPKWSSAVTPGRYLSVDETIIPCRGRISFMCYSPMKRKRFGIKVYTLCDREGYTLKCIFYVGKNHGKDALKPDRVVENLTEAYRYKGHWVCFDNWFSRYKLFVRLLKVGIKAVGTVRKDRKDLDKDLISKKKHTRGRPTRQEAQQQLKKYDAVWSQSHHKVHLVKWKDGKKEVYLLSTLPRGKQWTTCRRSGKVRGKYKKSSVPMPQQVAKYNIMKGGTDLADAIKDRTHRTQQSPRWYLKVFIFILETCILNSFILMRRGHGGVWTDGSESGWRSKRFSSFKLALIAQLIGTFKCTRAAPTLLIAPSVPPSPPSVPPSPQSVSIPDRLKPALGHYLGKMEKARQCAVHAKRTQTMYYCERCNQALCAYPCFKMYHTLQNYKIPCDVPKPPTSQKSSMPDGGVKRRKL